MESSSGVLVIEGEKFEIWSINWSYIGPRSFSGQIIFSKLYNSLYKYKGIAKSAKLLLFNTNTITSADVNLYLLDFNQGFTSPQNSFNVSLGASFCAETLNIAIENKIGEDNIMVEDYELNLPVEPLYLMGRSYSSTLRSEIKAVNSILQSGRLSPAEALEVNKWVVRAEFYLNR